MTAIYILMGLIVLGKIILWGGALIQASEKSSDDKSNAMLWFICSVVAILYLAYDCSSH
jgi:hypothetical protein